MFKFFPTKYQVHPEKFSTFGYNPSSFSKKTFQPNPKKHLSWLKKLFKYEQNSLIDVTTFSYKNLFFQLTVDKVQCFLHSPPLIHQVHQMQLPYWLPPWNHFPSLYSVSFCRTRHHNLHCILDHFEQSYRVCWISLFHLGSIHKIELHPCMLGVFATTHFLALVTILLLIL